MISLMLEQNTVSYLQIITSLKKWLQGWWAVILYPLLIRTLEMAATGQGNTGRLINPDPTGHGLHQCKSWLKLKKRPFTNLRVCFFPPVIAKRETKIKIYVALKTPQKLISISFFTIVISQDCSLFISSWVFLVLHPSCFLFPALTFISP